MGQQFETASSRPNTDAPIPQMVTCPSLWSHMMVKIRAFRDLFSHQVRVQHVAGLLARVEAEALLRHR